MKRKFKGCKILLMIAVIFISILCASKDTYAANKDLKIVMKGTSFTYNMRAVDPVKKVTCQLPTAYEK